MAFLALLIAVVLIVVAVRGTHGELLTALGQDVPGFAVWGAAVFAVAAIGFIPGLKPVSRGLLALVVLVIVLTNYQAILAGFSSTWQGADAQAKGSGAGSPGGSSSGLSIGGFDLGSLGFNATDFTNLLSSDTSGASAAVNG